VKSDFALLSQVGGGERKEGTEMICSMLDYNYTRKETSGQTLYSFEGFNKKGGTTHYYNQEKKRLLKRP